MFSQAGQGICDFMISSEGKKRERMQVNGQRIKTLKDAERKKGPVVYWMSREQRVKDNWALLYAQELAMERKAPLLVVFSLVPQFLGATMRHYDFMLKGLACVEGDLAKLAIPFYLLEGKPEKEISDFLMMVNASVLVSDFDPLRIKREWKGKLASRLSLPFYEVDAHNIVPCWIASSKQEYGAYTLRPKLKRLLPQFLIEYPMLERHPHKIKGKGERIDWQKVRTRLKMDSSVGIVDAVGSGEAAAAKALGHFIANKLDGYNLNRNDPCLDGQSNLSPYLHFGQLAAQRVALEVTGTKVDLQSKDAFLEELIVRRELSDNFCFYNERYDHFEGFPHWAQESLNQHRSDTREYTYSISQLEEAITHDPLWNAAQTGMVRKGKMHGYMRMYWCKKILEWTKSPEEALSSAIYLNDKYELDGRDPNGYAGIAWSIGGVHDRAWFERKIFGKVRFMSYGGCKSKFDVETYIKQTQF
jgi:deoxyribodipyrimidine photo-lyase